MTFYRGAWCPYCNLQLHAYIVLTDADNRVARRYGLVYKLSQSLHDIYLQIGLSLPDYNGNQSWELPISATYILDQSGTIRTAFINADFTHRLEPSAVLKGIQGAKSK